MESKRLIEELSNELEPVKPLPAPAQRLCSWLAASALCIVAAMSIVGLRNDFSTVASSPRFLLETLLIISSASAAAFAAFLLSIPGQYVRRCKLVLRITLSVWALSLAGVFVLRLATDGALELIATIGMPCVAELFAVGIVPGVLLFVMIRRAAPIHSGAAGVYAALAASLTGAIALQFTCSSTDAIHILLYHALPVVFVAWLGITLGRKFLTWESEPRPGNQA